MSIDSISNNSYQNQRKKIEEERAEELEDLEKTYRRQLREARSNRAKEVSEVRESESKEIEEARKHSESKVKRAQEGYATRSKEYQEESAKFNDEASKKLQEKANQLSRYSKELDGQREQLQKRHIDASRNASRSHEENYKNKIEELENESDQVMHKQNEKLKEFRENNSRKLSELRTNAQKEKQKELEYSKNEINKVKRERDMATLSLEQQEAVAKEISKRKLEHLINTENKVQNNVREQYETDLDSLHFKQKESVQGEIARGQKQVRSTREFYDEQLNELEKENHRKTLDREFRSQAKMTQLEKDQKTQEHLNRLAYMNKNKQFEESKMKQYSEHDSTLNKMKEDLTNEFQSQQKAINENHKKIFQVRNDEIQSELSNQTKIGKQQIDSTVLNNSKKISEYTSKSNDPFYKLRTISPDLTDDESEVVVKVSVPEHEQDLIRITGQPGAILISGSRRFEKNATTEEGRKISTNSNQSYSEKIPISGQPNFSKMTRDYSNGKLTVRIPKV